MTAEQNPGPLWPGHKPAQLYVVTQEPRHAFRQGLVSFVWFVHADNKTQAVRYFDQLCPEAANNTGDARYYKKPTAQLVITGGSAIRI